MCMQLLIYFIFFTLKPHNSGRRSESLNNDSLRLPELGVIFFL